MPSRRIILLVEDNSVNQAVASRMLRKLGFTVDIAESGETALERCGSQRYAFVFMDLHLPGLDGYATIREWRRREGEGVRTTVIALTGLAEDEGCGANLAAGFDGHLPKPLTREALEGVLGRWE